MVRLMYALMFVANRACVNLFFLFIQVVYIFFWRTGHVSGVLEINYWISWLLTDFLNGEVESFRNDLSYILIRILIKVNSLTLCCTVFQALDLVYAVNGP